ncbi:MAG: hypothetical protein RMY28_009700 [Nostoc sp. ChiSLP01]|nr:hypothetical protein [Nostoc sp. CmiSLP01]MDZ8285172.1 hypothetical protein [Nostoc sp. ChiSLP01]
MPICAVEHDVDQPHDATSFYYRFLFKNQYGRDVTWSDAMLHCPEEIRQLWTENLTKVGIDVNSLEVFGDITSQEDLQQRLF